MDTRRRFRWQTTVKKARVTTPNFDPASTFKTSQDNKCCVIALRRFGQELIEVTRSYCLGCVAPVKDRRLFNILGKGASWRVLCSMSQNLSFRIEAVGRLVSLTARIIRSLRDADITVPNLDFRFTQIERHIVLGHIASLGRTQKDCAVQPEPARQEVFCELLPKSNALFAR
jgi:hypothetical protein